MRKLTKKDKKWVESIVKSWQSKENKDNMKRTKETKACLEETNQRFKKIQGPAGYKMYQQRIFQIFGKRTKTKKTYKLSTKSR